MVNDSGRPSLTVPPLLKCGVTSIVAVTGEVPEFIAGKDDIFPVPLAASPIEVLLLVQKKVVMPPVLFVVKFTVNVLAPLHITWLVSWSTCAVGFTVIVKVFVGP